MAIGDQVRVHVVADQVHRLVEERVLVGARLEYLDEEPAETARADRRQDVLDHADQAQVADHAVYDDGAQRFGQVR